MFNSFGEAFQSQESPRVQVGDHLDIDLEPVQDLGLVERDLPELDLQRVDHHALLLLFPVADDGGGVGQDGNGGHQGGRITVEGGNKLRVKTKKKNPENLFLVFVYLLKCSNKVFSFFNGHTAQKLFLACCRCCLPS